MMRSFIAALLLALTTSLAGAEPPRQINWDDLIPEGAPLVNPFNALPIEAREDLAIVFRTKADLELGLIPPDGEDMRLAHEAALRVETLGVDIDALEAELNELQAEIDRRNMEVNRGLDGEVVRLPGYALPLELSDGGVSEFLLVPYVGACIHTPPPPPNQMVFVKLREEFEITNLYEPVWITGQIRVEQASRSLTYVDGTADVPTGYALQAVTIEPYE
ncbi:MAG: DUF3299 domain-containing protein [Pseudomonadota bacterium]